MTITIYGASDDLIEVSGHVTEEYNVYSDNPVVHLRDTDGTGIDVVLHYGGNGCWSAGASRIEEDAPMPWPVAIVEVATCAYSSAAVIECPDTVTISLSDGGS